MSFLFSKTLNTLLGKYPLYCCVFILFVYPPFLRAQLENDIDVFTKMGAESKPAGFNELPSLIKAHQYAASASSQINVQRYRIYAEKAANDGLNSLMLPSVDLRLGLYRNRYQSDDPVLSYQGDAFNAVSDCQGALNVDGCILTVLDGVSYASQKSDFSKEND